MKKEIELNTRKIEYTLRLSPRARCMSLAIYCDGNFVVTAPQHAHHSKIEDFIIKKSQWVIKRIDYYTSLGHTLLPKSTKIHYEIHRDRALAIVQDRIKHYNTIYNFNFNNVSVKRQKTRWGSCSATSNLNFNYQIMLLPQRLVDYIVVHELCHIGEFNHSQDFWNLVAVALPNYKELRRELRKMRLR